MLKLMESWTQKNSIRLIHRAVPPVNTLLVLWKRTAHSQLSVMDRCYTVVRSYLFSIWREGKALDGRAPHRPLLVDLWDELFHIKWHEEVSASNLIFEHYFFGILPWLDGNSEHRHEADRCQDEKTLFLIRIYEELQKKWFLTMTDRCISIQHVGAQQSGTRCTWLRET